MYSIWVNLPSFFHDQGLGTITLPPHTDFGGSSHTDPHPRQEQGGKGEQAAIIGDEVLDFPLATGGCPFHRHPSATVYAAGRDNRTKSGASQRLTPPFLRFAVSVD